MSEFYKWDPTTLSVDVKEMDDEHQILIKKMNALHAAHVKGTNTTELGKMVDDFAKFTIKHFSDEESYMEKVKFPGLATHKLIHKQLLEKVTEHIGEFQRSGVLTDAFFKFLSIWLTSHIRGVDVKYGKEFKKAG